MQFVHPVLFIGSVDLSAQEILDFPFVMESVFTEQHVSLPVSETGYLSGHLIEIQGESPSSLSPRLSSWYCRFLLNKEL